MWYLLLLSHRPHYVTVVYLSWGSPNLISLVVSLWASSPHFLHNFRILFYCMTWCELREYKWNEYVTTAVNRNLSNCEIARKKVFRGFNGIWTRGLCVSAAVLSQLSYEDPYTGGWWESTAVLTQRPRVQIPLKPRKTLFFRAISQLPKLRFTAMVTYSFLFYCILLLANK